MLEPENELYRLTLARFESNPQKSKADSDDVEPEKSAEVEGAQVENREDINKEN